MHAAIKIYHRFFDRDEHQRNCLQSNSAASTNGIKEIYLNILIQQSETRKKWKREQKIISPIQKNIE